MKTVLCFGDSNTWGYIPASASQRHPRDIRWTGLLQKLLGDEYVIVENGLNGRTTCFDDPTWPGRNGYTDLPNALETQYPLDLVVIMLGTNDAKVFFPGQSVACGRALELYAQRIRGQGFGPDKGDPQILVISPILLSDKVVSDSFDPVNSVTFTKGLSSVYKRYCEALGLHFMDASQAAQADDADGIHMNPENHRKLAEAVCEKVRAILE